jgi:hypothetical protein
MDLEVNGFDLIHLPTASLQKKWRNLYYRRRNE